jgi:hypothetical protein
MKNIFIIILISAAFKANAQLAPAYNFIGEWVCTDVKITNSDELKANPSAKQALEMMRNIFLQSKFSFNANSAFSFELGIDKSDDAKEMARMFNNNNKWKLNNEKGLISIGTPQDNYSIMGLTMKEENDYMVFYLDDSPIILKMQRAK